MTEGDAAGTYRIPERDIRSARRAALYRRLTGVPAARLEEALGAYRPGSGTVPKGMYGTVKEAVRAYEKGRREMDAALAASGLLKRASVVVNVFGGPGAGKTTAALEIAAGLKKDGYTAKYVDEVASELIADGKLHMLDGTLEHQRHVHGEQLARQRRWEGRVDFVVTDSPPLLSALYVRDHDPVFNKEMIDAHKAQENFNLYIERGPGYSESGRIHNRAEAIEIDGRIKAYLGENGVYYGTYSRDAIRTILSNIEQTYERVDAQAWTAGDDARDTFAGPAQGKGIEGTGCGDVRLGEKAKDATNAAKAMGSVHERATGPECRNR